MRYRILDLDIKEVSYVDRPANRRKFVFVKNKEGGNGKVEFKLEDLNLEDRKKLEIEMEKSLTPIIKKKLDETYRPEFEKTFTEEKIEEIKLELGPDIEERIREEFGKQDKGVSKEAAAKITGALKDIVRGVTAIGKLVGSGYGYKSDPADEDRIKDLEKEVEEIKKRTLSEADLKTIIKEVNTINT